MKLEYVKVTLEVNRKKITKLNSGDAIRTLGIYMYPSLKWDKQFYIIVKKALEAISKLTNTTIQSHLVFLYFNIYLIKSMYFGYGIISLTDEQE